MAFCVALTCAGGMAVFVAETRAGGVGVGLMRVALYSTGLLACLVAIDLLIGHGSVWSYF